MIIKDFHMTIQQIHMNIMQIQNIYMYCGVTSIPMLVLIICCICLMLSAHKDPRYSWWLQKATCQFPWISYTALDCSQGVHNDSWLKTACSSLNVRLSQSCCWDFILDITQGHPLRLEVNFLLELLVSKCNETTVIDHLIMLNVNYIVWPICHWHKCWTHYPINFSFRN